MAIAIIWQTVFGVQITAGPLEAAIDVDLVGSSFGLGWVGLGDLFALCGQSGYASVWHLVNCAPLKGCQHCGVYQRLEQLFISTLITGSPQAG